MDFFGVQDFVLRFGRKTSFPAFGRLAAGGNLQIIELFKKTRGQPTGLNFIALLTLLILLLYFFFLKLPADNKE
jgi:hypothetical protein